MEKHLILGKDSIETLDGMPNRDVRKYIDSNSQTSYEEWIEISEDQFLEETKGILVGGDSISEKIVRAMNLMEYKCIKEEGKKAKYFKRTGRDVNYSEIDASVVHYLHDRGVKI